MEDNPTNPTPEPKEPETAEPAPQDNFAEPTRETGTSWQPTQATAPQLGGMDVPPAMTQPAPAPKKSNVGVIIGIIAGVLVVVGAIVAIILLANGSKDSGGKGSGSVLSEQAQARNKQRETDLERILGAANDYVSNNKGKTPFGTEYDASKMGAFVNRYIDDGIDKKGADEGKAFVCAGNSYSYSKTCPGFTDVKGKVFGWTVNVAEGNKKNEKISYSSNDGMDYVIHVYVKATCGANEGTYTSASDEKTFAMFYIVEGGKTLCGDSENGLLNKTKEEPLKTDKKSIEKRDIQREDDLARLLTAVNDYQTNNSGKTPFGNTYNQATLGTFVKRYIDSNINSAGAASGKSFACMKSKCEQFTDPDGTVYGFTVDVAKSGSKNEQIKYSAEDGMDHIFHVYVNAGCGNGEGAYNSGTGERQIAIFYITEGEGIVCNDNH